MAPKRKPTSAPKHRLEDRVAAFAADLKDRVLEAEGELARLRRHERAGGMTTAVEVAAAAADSARTILRDLERHGLCGLRSALKVRDVRLRPS